MNGEKWTSLLGLLGIKATNDLDAELDAVIANVTGLKAGTIAEEVKLSQDIPVVLVNQMKKGRKAQLDSLVENRVISPALCEELSKKYLSDDSLRIDLTLSAGEGEELETEFDRTISLIEKVRSDKPIEAKKRETIKLSQGDEGEENPLLANANKRREAAKRGYSRTA